jgi:predicted NAD/FAD-binding protein
MLEAPTGAEREILSALPYQRNEAALHSDERVLPRSPRARASWNYQTQAQSRDCVAVTYDVRRLQGLAAPKPLLVSLNLDESIDAQRMLARESFDHPVFSPAGVAAQARHAEISGRDRISYCGAYWRNGFHEDGVVSGIQVARALGESFV